MQGASRSEMKEVPEDQSDAVLGRWKDNGWIMCLGQDGAGRTVPNALGYVGVRKDAPGLDETVTG